VLGDGRESDSGAAAYSGILHSYSDSRGQTPQPGGPQFVLFPKDDAASVYPPILAGSWQAQTQRQQKPAWTSPCHSTSHSHSVTLSAYGEWEREGPWGGGTVCKAAEYTTTVILTSQVRVYQGRAAPLGATVDGEGGVPGTELERRVGEREGAVVNEIRGSSALRLWQDEYCCRGGSGAGSKG